MFAPNQLLEKINAHIANLQYARPPQGLYDPISYVLALGGKRIRPVLMMMAYNLYRDDVEAVYAPATAIEVYHNYTLLHDDLMDRADKRRGKETVHRIWGDNAAILSGDAMLVLAYQYMAQCPTEHLKKLMDIFNQTALEICEGQQMDMEFEQRNDVDENEYLEMIRLKTSVLLAASMKIGAIMAGASDEEADSLYDFGLNLGLAFQLKDDLLDVYGDTTVFGKNIGGDILCNKKTYLLIQALANANDTQLQQLNEWIAKENYDPQQKIEAVTSLYNQIGVKAMCEHRILAYTLQAEKRLAALNVPESNKQQIKQLMNDLMNREV